MKKKMWDWLWWIGSNVFFYGASLLGLAMVSLYFFQNKLLYLPNGKPLSHSPQPRPPLTRQ